MADRRNDSGSMKQDMKMTVLAKIARAFEEKKIMWAVGGSLMLYFRGITDIVHDIDLMVTEEDIEEVRAVLLDLGTPAPPAPDSRYKTRYFLEFLIDEVEVDVIAGFVIVHDGKEYDCSLTVDQITDLIDVEDVRIPMQSKELWREYYRLMEREEKVRMIDHDKMKNVRNLIFDMGNVLLRYDPELIMDRAGVKDQEHREMLKREIFRSSGWTRLDTGEWNEEDMVRAAVSHLPEELHEIAGRLICEWDRPIVPIDGMEALLKKCREAGHRIFLLSNASRRQHEYWDRVPGAEYFEDTVISADVHLVKPDPEIYLHLLRKNGLKAKECLFVDDMKANTDAAEQLGIAAFCFRGDAKELERFLFF